MIRIKKPEPKLIDPGISLFYPQAFLTIPLSAKVASVYSGRFSDFRIKLLTLLIKFRLKNSTELAATFPSSLNAEQWFKSSFRPRLQRRAHPRF